MSAVGLCIDSTASSFVVGGRGLGFVGAPFFLRCAVADRTIVLAQNKRHAVRGVTVVNPSEFSAVHEEDDDLTYIVDMSSYLDGATISSVTRTASGPTVSNTSNTTTRITQRLKGFGYVDFKVTASSGDVEEFRLTITPRASRVSTQIAQVPDPMPLATTSTSDPTSADDTTRNFYPGSVWINTASGNMFDCVSNAQGAAIWRHRQRVLGQSGSAVLVTGTTSETVLATVTIPANAIGANGQLHIHTHRQFNNDASGKTSRIRFSGISGTAYRATADASTAGISDYIVISNAGSTSSQVGGQASTGNGLGVGTITTSSVDTTAATTLVITGQLTDTADTITLMSYRVVLTRPDIT